MAFFDFDDQETSPTFDKYVDFNGLVFKLKDSFSMSTNVSQVEGFVQPLDKILITNRYLVKYLSNFDFSEIVFKKTEIYGVKSTEEIDGTKFSYK